MTENRVFETMSEIQVGQRVIYVRNSVRYLGTVIDTKGTDDTAMVAVKFDYPHLFCRNLTFAEADVNERFLNEEDCQERLYKVFSTEILANTRGTNYSGETHLELVMRQPRKNRPEMVQTVSGKILPKKFCSEITHSIGNNEVTYYFSFYDLAEYTFCYLCGELMEICSDRGLLYVENHTVMMHKDCLEHSPKVKRCTDCGCTNFTENMIQSDDGDYYCPDCFSSNFNIIRSYHSFKSNNRYNFCGDTHNNTVPYLGFELETDSSDYKQRIICATKISKLFGDFAKLEDDGSIDGFETITQPATLEYHQSLGATYKTAMEIFKEHDELDTDNCGLHVHINRSYFDDVEKGIINLFEIFDKFWDDIATFSRRNIEKLDRWAKKNDKDEIHSSDRYCAVNVSNRNTIEFRVFRSTTDYLTLMQTLNFVNNITIIAKYMTLDDIATLTWEQLMSDNFAVSLIPEN